MIYGDTIRPVINGRGLAETILRIVWELTDNLESHPVVIGLEVEVLETSSSIHPADLFIFLEEKVTHHVVHVVIYPLGVGVVDWWEQYS